MGKPAPGTQKRDHQDSAATERAAEGCSVPEEYWRSAAGPLQVAMVLAARSPMAFARLAMVSAVTAALVLLSKDFVKEFAWRLRNISGQSPPPYETAALWFGLLVGAIGAWTILAGTHRLLQGERDIDLGGCVLAWAQRLPQLVLTGFVTVLAAVVVSNCGGAALEAIGPLRGWPALGASLVSLLVADRILALGYLAVPAVVLEERPAGEALLLAWERAGWPGWGLWTVASTYLAFPLLVALTIGPLVVALDGVGRARGVAGLLGGGALVVVAVMVHTLLAMSWACVAETRQDPWRPRPGGLGVALRALGAFLVLAVAVPNFQAARSRAGSRACFANQKTIAGALEMYALDFGVPAVRYDEAMRAELAKGGYLCMVPCDPGYGAGSEDAYVTLPPVEGGVPAVMCLHHGALGDAWVHERSPRDYLRDQGVTDPDLLARASDRPYPGSPWPRRGLTGPMGAWLAYSTWVGAPAPMALLAWTEN